MKREVGLNSRVNILSNLMLVSPRLLRVHTVLLQNVLPTPNSAIFLACLSVLNKKKIILPAPWMCKGLSCLSFNSKFPMVASAEKGFGRGNQTLREHNFSWKTFETWKENWSAIERVRPCVEVLYPVTRINPRNEDNLTLSTRLWTFSRSLALSTLSKLSLRDSCVKWSFYCNTPQHTLSTESYSFLCCSKNSVHWK